MIKSTKKEKTMYFVSENEYIYFPFSNINCIYNNTNKYRNQLICLNPIKQEVNAFEWI